MKDTVSISGLRFQKYDNGTIHIHDDSRNIKFIGSSENFRNDVQYAFDELMGEEGIIEIKGTTETSLYLGKNDNAYFVFLDNAYFVFLKTAGDVKTQIRDFLKKL